MARVVCLGDTARGMTIARNRPIRANALTPPINRRGRIGALMTNDTPRTECPASQRVLLVQLSPSRGLAAWIPAAKRCVGNLKSIGLGGRHRFRLRVRTLGQGGRHGRRLQPARRIGWPRAASLGGFFSRSDSPWWKSRLQGGIPEAAAPGQKFGLGLSLAGRTCGTSARSSQMACRCLGRHRTIGVAVLQRPLAPKNETMAGSVELASRGAATSSKLPPQIRTTSRFASCHDLVPLEKRPHWYLTADPDHPLPMAIDAVWTIQRKALHWVGSAENPSED